MEQVKKLLEERENQLLQLKKEKEKALKNVPEGMLRICSHGKRTLYYHRNNPKDFNGVYIQKKDFMFAKQLAQKDYDKKVLGASEKELQVIRKYLADYPDIRPEQIYEKMHIERQKLVEPIRETDAQFVERWESEEYEGKGFREDVPELFTAKGERVRSKTEIIIADYLNRENIPYRYESPLLLKRWGNVYPDFTVLNVKQRKEIYWEHLGMMDDPAYVINALQKIEMYEQHGVFPGENLILTYETKKNPINQKIVKLMIQHYLK